MSTRVASKGNRVVERLVQLSESWSLFSILTGVVVAGWISVGTLMAFALLDVWLRFESLGRSVLLGLWVTVSLAAALYLMVRPVLRKRTLEGVARRLEEIFPELGSHLINLVQLSRETTCPSKLLHKAAINQATRQAESVPLHTAPYRLDWRRRLELGMQTPRDLGVALLVGAVIAGLALLCHATMPAWSNSVYRLFHPLRFVPAIGDAQILEVTPGDTAVLRGSSLTVRAKVANPEGKEYEGVLVAVSTDGSRHQYALLPSERFDEFSFVFPKVGDAFQYRLEIGGTQTPFYRVDVFDRPTITGLKAVYRYPSYMERPEEEVELKGGAIEVPQFTRVDLTITTLAPVQTAAVRLGSQQYEGMARQTEPVAVVSFPATESGFYTIHLEDSRGNTNDDSIRFPLRVTPDQPPQVEITAPAPEITAAAGETVTVEIRARDDYGLSRIELRNRVDTQEEKTEQTLRVWDTFDDPRQPRIRFHWRLPESLPGGTVVFYRAVVFDNRKLTLNGKSVEPQQAATALRRIRIVDRDAYFANKLKTLEQLRQELWRILKLQTEARVATTPLTTAQRLAAAERKTASGVRQQQQEIQSRTQKLADSINTEQTALAPFKTTLSNLAQGRMTDAVRSAESVQSSGSVEQLRQTSSELVNIQDDILDILRKLLDLARMETTRTLSQMEKRPGGDLPNDVVGQLQDLSEKLKEFVKEQRKVIEATEDLAKKPVEDYTEEEEQKFKELAEIEDDWSKFMNEAFSDLSRLPEQDFSNPTLLQELIEIETEIKMAEDALLKKSAEIAVPLEQLGAEMAEEITTNLEKWLPDTPDREQWSQEEPLTDAMREAPMAELPGELEDLVGELMEEEEDLFDEMEDISSSWADSLDKGAGWDASDGPISNMSAKGVTGNRLPNTSEIGGRSGEGRTGKSSGEFVGEEAVGKGGRKTPSRLTPDPFEAGQIKDSSTDPVGGSTGGGKESGQGGEGLEGPIPPPLKRELGRLAGQQATLRNRAETIKLQFQIANYNTAELDQLIERMKKVEQHLRSGHFRSALRQRDIVLESLSDLRAKVTEQRRVKQDSTSSVPKEIRDKILGNMAEKSPDGWEELNRSYFERIANGE